MSPTSNGLPSSDDDFGRGVFLERRSKSLAPMRMLVASLLVAFLVGASLQAGDYEIGSGDVLKVAVFNQQDLSGEFEVDAQGLMSFPFLGKVKASGLTTLELEKKLSTLLADGYIRQPHVSVTVKDYRSQRVYVTGELQKPGPYGLRPGHSLRALLADLGDLTSTAGHEVIVIRPPKEAPPSDSPEASSSPKAASTTPKLPLLPGEVEGSTLFHVSLRDVRSGNPDQDFQLEPGDTVYFPKAAQVYVSGRVSRPGAIPFLEGMTVYQAISLAGGATERAAVGGVRILRFVGGIKKEFKAKPTEPLLPEDTVIVPERFF